MTGDARLPVGGPPKPTGETVPGDRRYNILVRLGNLGCQHDVQDLSQDHLEAHWRTHIPVLSPPSRLELQIRDIQRMHLRPGDTIVITVTRRLTAEDTTTISDVVRDGLDLDDSIRIMVLDDGADLRIVDRDSEIWCTSAGCANGPALHQLLESCRPATRTTP